MGWLSCRHLSCVLVVGSAGRVAGCVESTVGGGVVFVLCPVSGRFAK